MNSVTSILIGLIISGCVCTNAANQPPPKPDELETKIESYLAGFVAAHDMSGCVLVARGDEALFRKAYGMANFELGTANRVDTVFSIGSVTKQFTAAAILKLREQGHLKLSDPLTKHIPDFPNGDKIRIEHLLHHTSGLRRDAFADWREEATPRTLAEMVALIQGYPLDFAPGARESYSNPGYTVLAYLIERLGGMSYEAYLRQYITGPIGLEKTGHDQPPASMANQATGYDPGPGEPRVVLTPYFHPSAKAGAGSMISTVDELWRWNRALHGGKVLTAESYKIMTTPPKIGRAPGLGLYSRFGKRVIGHDGVVNGFNASLEYFPSEDLVVVYLGNIRSGTLSAVASGLAGAVLGKTVQPDKPPTQRALPQGADLDSYTGRYQLFPGFHLTISRDKTNLHLSGTGGYPTYLYPTGQNAFYYRSMYASIRFEKVEGGKFQTLIWTGTDGQG